MFLFVILPFAVYTHARQECVSICDFAVRSLYSCRPSICLFFIFYDE